MKTATNLPTHCACGNAFPIHTAGYTGASGYATLPDGSHICYTCADTMQREELKDRSRPFGAYLSGDGARVTSWTGGKLGDVVRTRTIRLTRQSFTHGSTIQSVKVRDVHGGMWVGQSSPNICIRLRPVKS